MSGSENNPLEDDRCHTSAIGGMPTPAPISMILAPPRSPGSFSGTLGAWMQVGDERFDSEEIHRLYESDDYPLRRRTG
jgi:hypothetical protein